MCSCKVVEEEPTYYILRSDPYHELMGSFLCAAQISRPDIAHAVNYFSRSNNNFKLNHWIAAIRILRYLKGTIDFKLNFIKDFLDISGY